MAFARELCIHILNLVNVSLVVLEQIQRQVNKLQDLKISCRNISKRGG